MEKRGYKLQEFVAHSSNVNSLSIGKKTGSLFVTGGEDHKVNLWTIGKSSSLLSLSGHTSSVETVTFDSTEGLILSGASTGAIKLWDLDEGKIIRSLTGHRLNCTAVEFHPFGEFFASGSSDANLKLWDIRKKGCLHTYKGHTEGINAIKFTPDGRWVVSGGSDNVVKIWDLTAGKLLHEFKFHVGHIRCIDFHPMEFLLATGSADRTVKFWDLETFELIGSAGPEATGINSMTFHPDGRTLFCGLDDCLKIFSWEPIKCQDAVDMGWSTLGDLSIRDDKLLACAYDRNCVQVWVSDITKLESKTKPTTKSRPDLHECGRNIYVDTGDVGKTPTERVNSVDSPKVVRRLDTFELFNPSTTKTTPKSGPHERTMSNITSRAFTPPTPKSDRHERTTSNITSRPFTPPTPKSDRHERTISNITSRPFTPPAIVSKSTAKNLVNSKRESVSNTNSSAGTRLEPSHMRRSSSFGTFNTLNVKGNFGSEQHERATRPFTPPVTVRRSNADSTINSRRESIITERSSPGMKRETSHATSLSHSKSETKLSIATESGTFRSKRGPDSPEEPKFHFSFLTINEPTRTNEEDNHFESDTEKFGKTPSPDEPLSSSCENGMEVQNCSGVESSVKLVSGGVLAVEPGRTRSLVQRWERREICHDREAPSTNAVCDMIRETNRLPATVELKDQPPISEIEETGHITRERDGPGHVEASGHMIREKEAINHIIRERAASCHTKTEREASGHIKNERETVKHTEKEQDISRLTRKQREISNLTEKEKEVTELLGKESQRTRLAEKEREISNVVTREREASRLIEKEREVSRLTKIEREPSGLIEIEEETSGLFESEMEVSRFIGSGREAEQLTKIGYTSDGSEKEREASGTNDQDIIKALMQNHDTSLSGLRSRLTKLQVVKHFWLRNDIKGGIDAVGKMPDHCVQADVATVVVEKTEMVTLDLFTCLLPLFMGLLNSDIDRHTSVSLEMLLKLVAIFGPVIRSAISASPSVRVDLQADRRREICNQCFVQLQKIKLLLPSVIRRGGSLAKGAQELNLVLQEL